MDKMRERPPERRNIMLEASEDDEEDDEDDEEDEDEDETDWDGVENDVLEYERIRRSETKPVEVKSWPKTLGECSSEENRDKVIFFTSEDMQSTRKALKKFWCSEIEMSRV